MNNYPPFSVAMSVYMKDDPAYFDLALQSITIDQTVQPTEVVLVCDGPLNEGLNSVIEKYLKLIENFKVIRLSSNQGLGNALRVAIENTTFELVARMDSDDISVSNRFDQQLSYFKNHPKVDIVGGDIAEFINDLSNIVGTRVVPKSDKEIKNYMKKRSAFNHVSVMYKKHAVMSAGGYLDWFWNEDYYLWIRMLLNNACFANTGTVLVNVRVGEDMYRRRGGSKYFKSEVGLQIIMLKEGIINLPTFVLNIAKRFIVQILLPNSIRGFVFKTFARE